jgi:hypothetical protein
MSAGRAAVTAVAMPGVAAATVTIAADVGLATGVATVRLCCAVVDSLMLTCGLVNCRRWLG